MSILIKGMEMPKSCYECRFAFDGMCIANRGRKDVGITNSCPLIEVPKHGRLIDAEALKEIEFCGLQADKKIIYQMGWNDAIEAIAKNAPTIIQAEEDE